MHLFGFLLIIKVIGNYDTHNMGTTGSLVLDKELIGNIYEIDKRMAEAYDKEDKDIKWLQSQVTCPVCHQDLFNGKWNNNSIIFNIYIEGEKLNVEFSKKKQARVRGTLEGLREHTTEIQGFGAICAPKLIVLPKCLISIKTLKNI